MYETICFPKASLNIVKLLKFCQKMGEKWYLIVPSICISPTMSEVKHHSCLRTIFVILNLVIFYHAKFKHFYVDKFINSSMKPSGLDASLWSE